MEYVTRWHRAHGFRRRRAPLRGGWTGVLVLTLALGSTGLLLPTAAVSAARPPLQVAGAALAPPLRPRPPRTPTPTPTATVAPRPTATPTATRATVTPTAAATGRGDTVPTPRGQAGSGTGSAPRAAPPLGVLLGWSLAALVGVFLAFSVALLLATRRTVPAPQHATAFPPVQPPTRARLHQLYQLLPARPAEPPRAAGEAAAPPQEEGHAWTARSPAHASPAPPPLKPPRWLLETGWLKADTGEWSTADQQEPWGGGKAVKDGPDERELGAEGG